MTKQSRDLDKALMQKSSIVDFSRIKIAMLKDQVSAAEKVLQANEQSLLEIRNQKRLVDLKLTKLQNMRKTQQEMLQKLLNPAQSQMTAPTASKSPSPPPQLPPSPPPPLLPAENQQPSRPPLAPTPKPNTPIVSSILNKMTLGSVVANTVKSKETLKGSKAQSDLTRPNLTTSKQTDKKLQCLELKGHNIQKLNICLNENIVVNAKVVSSCSLIEADRKNDGKKIQLENKNKLIELMDNLSRDYPHIFSQSFDQWSYEFLDHVKPVSLCFEKDLSDSCSSLSSISIQNVLTSSNYCQFNQCSDRHSNLTSIESNQIHIIDNVENYESPLKVFRGYRFSSHFSQFSPFEEAYSKTYCNSIDYRRPFCPFDLHGSCKDSNCLYQHSNKITMDNYQRTEHFLSYCPQVLELSSDTPTQREAIKKLSNKSNKINN